MKKILTLFLLGSILLSCTPRQQEKMSVVILELEGIRYDSLALVLWFEGEFVEQIRGHSDDGYRWEFFYADSLRERLNSASFVVLGTPDSVEHSFGMFNLVLQGDTLRSGIFPESPKTIIRARYIKTETHYDVVIQNIVDGMDFLMMGTLIIDDFEIFTEDQALISSMKVRSSGYFFPDFDTITFNRIPFDEEAVQRQAEFIRQHPNSQFALSMLYDNAMFNYESMDDVAKLLGLFSPRLQQSFFGRKIRRQISSDEVFVNQKLPTWDTEILEQIIQDSSRYNLVIFAVSWCGVYSMLPIHKEIYQDLGQKIIMTYVSLDEEWSAEYWRELMREYEIPWRSLMVLNRDRHRIIRYDYAIRGSRLEILVHPNSMKMERLRLWEEADRQRLRDLVK